MKQFVGTSKSGSVQEAVKGLSNPEFIILFYSEKKDFPEKVKELEALYPGVPSIGCVGESYGGMEVMTKGLTVTAFSGGITAISNVLEEVRTMPVKYIKRFEEDARAIGGSGDNVVCIDVCAANDECVIATMHTVLGKRKISLTGGTAWEGTVCCNGKVYEEACAYAFVRNNQGRVKVYKENLYEPTDKEHVVTKADPKNYILEELDGKPAENVYMEELGISASQIAEEALLHPFGRIVGDEVYIISIKEQVGKNQFTCYRKVNPKDKLSVLQLGDYQEIIKKTTAQIKEDFPRVGGVFSINCVFRYLLFEKYNYTREYFGEMAKLGTHSGLIGLGEHYEAQHTNQTLSCVVFE